MVGFLRHLRQLRQPHIASSRWKYAGEVLYGVDQIYQKHTRWIKYKRYRHGASLDGHPLSNE